eukprot:6491647-Amphidinium_carterae.1
MLTFGFIASRLQVLKPLLEKAGTFRALQLKSHGVLRKHSCWQVVRGNAFATILIYAKVLTVCMKSSAV